MSMGELAAGRRVRSRLDPPGLELHVGADLVQRLDEGAVEQPSVTRPDPPDAAGIDALVQQPVAGVHRGLAGADDREARRRVLEVDEVVRRNEAHALVDVERRRVPRRDRRLGVRRVDEPATDPDRRLLTGEQ